MAVYQLYSKRNKPAVDVFTYDNLPPKLRRQIVYVWQKYFNQYTSPYDFHTKNLWKEIHQILREEYGRKHLVSENYSRYADSYVIELFFEATSNLEVTLDVVELVFRIISISPKEFLKSFNHWYDYQYPVEEAIQDLNTRFLENGIGYEFRDGEIIRIDNKLLHQDIVIPALHFLSAPEFKNANEEYLSAHEHFRHKRTKECLVDCLKAMESTIKIICDLNGWPYKQTDNISRLISTIIEHKLIPDYLLQHFSSLRSTLESGVPTIRNKMGGHGAGTQALEVPMHYASYMLYLTGASINFLVSCHNERVQ